MAHGLVLGARVEVRDGGGNILPLVDPERFAARVRPLLAVAEFDP